MVNKKNSKKVVIIAALSIIIVVLLLILKCCSKKNDTGSVTQEDTTSTQEVIQNDDKKEEVKEEETKEEVIVIEEEKPIDGYSYYVNFLNIDGSLLQRSVYKKGETPSYKGETPTYSAALKIYTFTGWDKAFTKVSGTQTYTATYNVSAHTCSHYTIQSDGSWLCSECNALLKDTDDAYFTVLDTNNQPTTIQPLTATNVTGSNGISKSGTNISYSNNSSTAKDVVIRTDGGSLTINDTNEDSHQIHYGAIASANITTGNSCFSTHGAIGKLDLVQGKVIADENAYVVLSSATANGTIEEKNDGKFAIDESTPTSYVKDVKVIINGQNSNNGITDLGYDVSGSSVKTINARPTESYEIYSKEDLYEFRDLINKGINIPMVKFCSDIDITNEEAWIPIGTFEHPYHGYINGNNKTISGLHADTDGLTNNNKFTTYTTQLTGTAYGFIAIAGNGDLTIENLNFDNVDINLMGEDDKGNAVGIVLGYAPRYEDFNGDPDNGDEAKAGGIGIGNNGLSNLTLTGIKVSGSVKADDSVGSLIGKTYNSNALTIKNCVSDTAVTSNYRAGGLVGYIRKNTTSWDITNNTVKNTIVSIGLDESTDSSNSCVDKIAVFEQITNEKKIYNNSTSGAKMKYVDSDLETAYTLSYDNDYVVFEKTRSGVGYSYNYNANCVTFVNAKIINQNDIELDKLKLYGKCEVDNSSYIDNLVNYGTLTINNIINSVSGNIGTLTNAENCTISLSGGSISTKFTNSSSGTATLNDVEIINFINKGESEINSSVITTFISYANSNTTLNEAQTENFTNKGESEINSSNINTFNNASADSDATLNETTIDKFTSNKGNLTINNSTIDNTEAEYLVLGNASISGGKFKKYLRVNSNQTLTINDMVTISRSGSYDVLVKADGIINCNDKNIETATKKDENTIKIRAYDGSNILGVVEPNTAKGYVYVYLKKKENN